MLKRILPIFVISLLAFSQCSKNEDTGFNLFSVDKDIELGQQLRDEIAANPSEYPVLDESQYPEAYEHLRRMRDNILAGGEVYYKDKFDWEVYIIHDDEVMNAFAAPGGYMYFYTGLIKYLKTESAFAGVIGHEMAHADKRHTTERLTKIMGVQTVLNILLGKGAISDVLTTLMALQYSRDDEYEADEWSVRYLCSTGYIGDGAAQFFEQLEADGHTGGTFEWLSTHPSPDNRIEELHKHGDNYGCSDTETIDQWQDFQNSLP